MRSIFLFIVCIYFQINSSAQCDDLQINGKWKVVGANNGDVYFNLKSDSVWLSKETIDVYPEIDEQKKYVSNAKRLYTSYSFIFSNEKYEHYLDTVLMFKGTYCYNKSNGLFTLTYEVSPGRVKIDSALLRKVDGLLYYSKNWTPESNLDLILEKVR